MSETRDPRPRRRRLSRTALGLLVLIAVIGYFAVQRYSNGGMGAPYCTATATGAGSASEGTAQSYEMSPEQAANAATIAAVGIAKGLPDRAVTIALATAMQESALRNLDHGDRDSLGLFQQRPSQGWGTPEQIMDPVYSAGIFYDRLAEIKGYTRLPLTVAAQKVQLSGFPQAYAKHETDATVVTAAFGDNGTGALACSGPAPSAPGDPAKVKAELSRAFGKEALYEVRDGAPGGRSAPGPVREAEVSVQLKPGGGAAAEARRGRAMAHWAVAHARELGIARVSYGMRAWVSGKDGDEWEFKGGRGGKDGDGDPHNAGPGEVRIFVAR
ncbi:hypothetical protein [Streptomyces sp. ISL-94]|uniref:hypothetical protein n=1 Tax=Streptomyces sp. ISL-94 TaxID=2819190 RepID=UPI0027E3EF23|nr:hypothetical protein [Streptomyces sp. ISL-94]